MEHNVTTLGAYHESGRIYFAYLSGFVCDGLELSVTDPGKGKARLNGGENNYLIQQVLSGSAAAITPENKNKAVEVAMHLMDIYCAGTCARIYFEEDGMIDNDIELDVPVQDEKAIMSIQSFLTGINPQHDKAWPSKKMGAILHKLKDPATWKPISLLAIAAINSAEKPLTRFEIEDMLMAGGLKIKKAEPAGFSVGLTDTSKKKDTPAPAQATNPKFETEPVADILLKDFFRKIRNDWSEEEVTAAVKHVKQVMAKH